MKKISTPPYPLYSIDSRVFSTCKKLAYMYHPPLRQAIFRGFDSSSRTRPISYFLVKDGGWEWDSTEYGARSRNRRRSWTLQRLREWRTSLWWWVRAQLYLLSSWKCGKRMPQASVVGIYPSRSRGDLIPRKHASFVNIGQTIILKVECMHRLVLRIGGIWAWMSLSLVDLSR